MRIMELCSGRGVNGAINHCLELTRALAERGHDITLVYRNGAWIGQQPLPPNVERIESDMYPWHFRELHRVSKLARDRSIDIVHTHQSRANFFGVFLRLFCNHTVVATAHNRLFQLHWMWNDHVIAATEATRKYQQRYNLCSPDRLSVVHCFVDWERYSSVPREEGQTVRRSFGVDDSTTLLGVVGTVCKRKGLIYLVQALPQILARYPWLRVLVVGHEEQPYTKEVCDVATKLKVDHALIWAGQRHDTPRIMRALDLFCLPTLEDQMPIAILEAMASGLPVVATDVGGISEGVLHGQNGFLVRSANPQDLVDALCPLLADPALRQQIGAAASEHVRQEFTPESQSLRVETIMERVIAKRKTPRKSPKPSEPARSGV